MRMVLRSSFVLSVLLIACQGSVDPLANANEDKKNADKNKSTTPASEEPETFGPTGPTAFVPKPYTPDAPFPGPRVEFTIGKGGSVPGYYDTPWPSELFRKADGSIAFEQFPEASRLLVSTYVAQAKRDLKAFSVAQTAYFHFSGTPSTSGLPTPGDSMRKESPVFLLDVDPMSPDKGTFLPLEFRYYDQKLTYVESRVLAAKPLPGFVMRGGNLYAYVVRRDFKADTGELLGTSADFEAVKWTSPRQQADEEAARLMHVSTFDYLASLGVEREDIAAVALFKTQSPHEMTVKMMDVATNLTGNKAPRFTDAVWGTDSGTYSVIQGHYCTPNFQSKIEQAPFSSGDGGTVAVDAYGNPQVVDIPPGYRDNAAANNDADCTPLMKARFTMTIPKGKTMPAGGWPLLVSAHGTGGDSRSFLGENDFSGWAAANGMAVVSTDQPLHGEKTDPGRRPGSDQPVILNIGGFPIPLPPSINLTPNEMFYNPVNPGAGRDNARQSTIDTVVLARLASSTNFDTAKVGSNPLLATLASHTRPRFDAAKILLAGHSQGSQTVAPQAAIDPLIKGVLLSGCGGDIRYGILRRTKPFEMRSLLSSLLAMQGDELDEFHPLMALAQSFADAVDPQSFARLYREPLPGRSKQNVLHYVGTNDNYNPRFTGVALAVALKGVQLEPVKEPIIGLSLLGISPSNVAVKGNNGDSASIAFVELEAAANYDGHFVLYYHPGAQALAKSFFGAVLSGAAGAPAIGPFDPTK
ncbi:MAG: hypothetical protein IT381_13375 [Deltaproteobacteria bacterium]|nr:hypothetical protein [Deltaproteobacteria bacterium]